MSSKFFHVEILEATITTFGATWNEFNEAVVVEIEVVYSPLKYSKWC